MARFFNKQTRTEAIKGIHDLTGCVELPDDNIFFSAIPSGKIIVYDDQGIPCGYSDIPIPVSTPDDEQAWVKQEMSVSDININLHDDSDARATATKTEWQAYRCQLRDYVKGGVVVGDRPQKPV